MLKMIYSLLAYLLANAAGLLLATLLLPGFRIDVLSFVFAVALFSGIQTLLGPLVTKTAIQYIPQIRGGIALVTIFVVLFIVDILMDGFHMGGLSNWLAATLLVWIGSLVAAILLPIYVFKELVQHHREERRDL
ncbi:hypothetical protein GCM10011534_42070 [Pseudooceanicola nanhaiensis]|uniref:4 TMS phage holin, superfamily IV n=2 Tax=Paracoccaceae TaxID=31989 RepID=A0A917WMM1_9RHOB|nr:phage holin family protein [Pseudooceanicola nanhaiensis]GGM15650.1 hypothetical protein GCM10011534_42070 [Pseudooceanicola nanhaiensis]